MKKILLVLLLLACAKSPTDMQMERLADVQIQACGPTGTVVGLRMWYNGDRFYQIPADSFAVRLAALPPSGWLVGMYYMSAEYAPGNHYRGVMMGTSTNFIYNPNGDCEFVFENTEESKNQARQRLGTDILYYTAAGIQNAEYDSAISLSFRWLTWPE